MGVNPTKVTNNFINKLNHRPQISDENISNEGINNSNTLLRKNSHSTTPLEKIISMYTKNTIIKKPMFLQGLFVLPPHKQYLEQTALNHQIPSHYALTRFAPGVIRHPVIIKIIIQITQMN